MKPPAGILPAFPKPKDLEGKVTLTAKQRSELLDAFCEKQQTKCCRCRCEMIREAGHMNTATLGHRRPEPMGARKRDNPDNIEGALCWKCNYEQGSKRT